MEQIIKDKELIREMTDYIETLKKQVSVLHYNLTLEQEESSCLRNQVENERRKWNDLKDDYVEERKISIKRAKRIAELEEKNMDLEGYSERLELRINALERNPNGK